MNDRNFLPWVFLVVGNPSVSSSGVGVRDPVDSPAAIFNRALSLTSIAKTICAIDDRRSPEWNAVTRQLWSTNVFSLPPHELVVDGVVRGLTTLSRQEPHATVILIPFNHCAVEEATWLGSAKGALRLASANQNTVYLLHDNPDNDPRIAVKKPETCSSSVLVGAVEALIALFVESRRTIMVDLVVEKPADADIAASAGPDNAANTPLSVVHVRLAEEYARLQRADIWHRRVHQIDLHA